MNEKPLCGVIRKMKVALTDPVSYQLPVGDDLCAVDQRVGKSLSLSFSGNIFCISCGRKTSKSFAQGYCFPCFKGLAECDMCILRPETCHHHLGTCRDEQWAEGHCMQHHYVYIANSSGLKVGITRGNQIPTRWIDQGATQALAIFKVNNRFHSGLLESTLKKYVSDRTDWRKMLKGGAEPVDMRAESAQIIAAAENDLAQLKNAHARLDWESLDELPVSLCYPVAQYPDKVTSLSFDKTANISGVLNGIKGQYLIFDHGVINIRKFSGYEVVVE
jgi:hypothetical protein